MNSKKILDLGEKLNSEEKHLVSRVADSIEAKDSYFLVFHTAFGDILTNTTTKERDHFLTKPVYQILDHMVEAYRTNPCGYQ